MSDRDRILEQALTHTMRQDGMPPGSACIDPETLAAWTDGGLDAPAVAALEAHASSCARCQTLIAAMAKTAPIAATAEAGESLRSTWFRWWLAPVAAAAAAVVMWMVVPSGPLPVTVEPSARENQVAIAPQAAPEAATLAAAPVAESAPAVRLPEKASKAPGVTQEAAQSQVAATADRQESAIAAAPAAPAPPAPSAPAAFRSFAPLVIAVPDSPRRWRVVGNRIERSDDNGGSWEAAYTLTGESISGGTAPSKDTCWLIGKAGVVLLSSDGHTFRRVDLPAAVDAISISATNASSATVTTVDGRTFQTTNAGRTWLNPA